MKFIINREQLLIPLQQIVSVIEKRQTMPILSNVFMKLTADNLELVGTDLEIQIMANIKIDISTDPGETTIPARKLLDICRLLPSQAEIKFELSNDKMKVLSGRSRFSLSTLPAENYPEFSETPLENQFDINAGLLKVALEKTVFCMANQDVRYYLNGLMLNISNSKIRMVASDGHRLSVYENELQSPTGYEARIIIPRKGVMELLRLLDDPETDLLVQFSSNNIKVAIKNIIFSAKLVDARYPDFNKVFLQDFRNPIYVQRQILKDALTRVAILSNEKFKGISLDISPNSLKITAHNPEHEEAEEELFIEYQDELTISFNAQYLLDAVSNMDSELAVISIASNLSSCIFEEPVAQPYRYIVMPMRL
ncbi:MAG: DNA polymerase III subunit beta [Methylomicrobium sp.]|nr:DNA polymerase III subunit beta [Methylomicrobium sp.]